MIRAYTIFLLCGTALAAPDTDCLSLTRYVVLSNEQAARAQLLECPNHAFGSMNDGIGEIDRRRAELLPGQISFVQFCVAHQPEALLGCMPRVDVGAINPFVTTSDRGPDSASLLWPRVDHPVINRLRELRELAGGKRILARIGIGGIESAYIIRRLPTIDEVEWMVLATIGADYKGIVWVGAFDTGGRLRDLVAGLLAYAEDLGSAQPVGWVSPVQRQPVAALAARDTLFVVLLNTDYLSSEEPGSNQPVPLDPRPQSGEVVLDLPRSVEVKSAMTLRGEKLGIRGGGDSVTVVPYRYEGGGDVLILSLRRGH